MTSELGVNQSQIKNIVDVWNNTYQEYLYGEHVHCLIELQSVKTPDSTAVVFGNQSLSYKELNARANKLAHFLLNLGVKPDMLVGVCVERSFEMVIALLGILKAGGAYVPFDPEYPQDRLSFMTEDSGVSILLTEKKYDKKNCSQGVKVVCLDTEWPSIDIHENTNPKCSISPDNLSYMIYTSGSTGRPKGVMNTHKALLNRLFWMQGEYRLTHTDKVLQKTSMSFDVSVWEFFWPLMTGAQLVMADAGGHRDSNYLIDTINEHSITTLHFVPSMLNLFLSATGLEQIKTVRQVFCSGEALPHELAKKFFSKLNSKLHNLYGPTEAAIDVTYWECKQESSGSFIPIGKPISNTQIYILDESLQLVPIGESGELHIGGEGVARGYWNRPELTAEKFIKNPFSNDDSQRLYKTGDLARYLPDGNIEYLGRIDFQVKIRGLRIELGEIEAVLLNHPAVMSVTVIVSEGELGERRLLAYLVVDTAQECSINALRGFLEEKLPEYMVPAAFIFINEMPLTSNGKVDRRALPTGKLKRPDLDQAYIAPKTRMEKVLSGIWADLLNLDCIGINDNFFDLGGNSLLGMMGVVQLEEQENIELSVVKLFQYPTVKSLASSLDQSEKTPDSLSQTIERITKQREALNNSSNGLVEIAIVGMSGRFPGAYSVDELWENLVNDVESVTFFTKEELGPGLDPEITNDPNYVCARGIISDGDKFDAAFFGVNPSEAKTMDPQQRVFLELAWAALENSGYTSELFDGTIGTYAGMGNNYYFPLNVAPHTDLVKMVGQFPIMVGNEKDHIATRVANKLNLTGPAVSVHTACSTALTAIDNAFFSLVTRQCDMALAGGISLQTPQYSGQLYQDGGVFAIDGHCRPFDADATGTMFSDSAGVVVLKRLDDAVRDRDTIYAVIKSTALNNDGAEKISYLAPSISGQKQVIGMALARAGVSADSISYIETHGTGTPIGDPIEVEALTQVYRQYTDQNQFCGIGSIKSNLGHPTIAAGVAGVIKVALSLKNEKIPSTLHYKKPNPRIAFEKSPFYVVSKLTDWPKGEKVRRGAVSSFGFGGTNGHLILEEAPEITPADQSRSQHLLMLSAKTKEALDQMTVNLADHLDKYPRTNVADMSYTLQKGRVPFSHRRIVVCGGADDAAKNLRSLNPQFSSTRLLDTKAPEVVFLFPGQGSQYVNMGRNFYESESCFKDIVDQCAEILIPHIGCDLRDILYPLEKDVESAEETLKNTYYQQPATFVIEYALAKLWNSWGVFPDLMVGHSIGEFVCATLSGVFVLEDVLGLIAARGRLMSELPKGSMLSVRLPASEVEKTLLPGLSLAASNGPNLSVVAGPENIVFKLQEQYEAEEVACTLLHTSHAFHSEMMEPAVKPFTELVARITTTALKIPFVSTLTAKWMTQNDVADPSYWGRHLRSPVKFCEAIQKVWEDPERILLEVGPRAVTSTLARQQAKNLKKQVAVASLAGTADNSTEWVSILKALGSLWLAGVEIDYEKLWSGQTRNRIPLPTYPFARKRYWVDPIENEVPKNVSHDSDVVSAEQNFGNSKNESIAISSEFSEKKEISQKLISILEEISGIEFGDDLDDMMTFSEMGLDSLFLTQIAFKLAKDFNVDVTFRQLMEDLSSVHKIAEYVKEQQLSQSEAVEKIEEKPVENNGLLNNDIDANVLACTGFQREIYDLIQKDGHDASCSFNESISVSLRGGAFDLSAMKKGLNEVFLRHEALQFIYSADGKTMQLNDCIDLEIPYEDISIFPCSEVNKRLGDILKRDFSTAFKLHFGPLYRAFIIKVSHDYHIIVMTSHLSVCDGWSLDVLVQDLGVLYSGLVTGNKPVIKDVALYRDYLHEELVFKTTKAYEQIDAYWRKKLSPSIPSLDFPFISKLPEARTYNGARHDLMIAPSLVRSLKDTAGHYNCSFYNVLLAGLKLLLMGLSDQNTLTVGMPMAGQSITDKSNLVGNCLSYVPLVSNIDRNQSFEQFINTLRGIVLDAIENGRYSFNEHSACKSLSKDSVRVPFIQVCLNMSPKMEGDQLNFHQLDVEYSTNPRCFESFELFINAVTTKDDELVLEFQYNSDLFTESEISSWQLLLAKLYEGISKNTNYKLSDYLSAFFEGGKTITDSVQPSNSILPPGDMPFYFGENNSLYGVCHVPKSTQGDTGVLFCYPIGQEYMRSHWAFRLLIKSLLANGMPVLKFDYFGTGDSLGEEDDWDVNRWVQDVCAAAEELKLKTAVKNVSIVSLRFGSVLAAAAIDKGLSVSQFIMWDPVVSGCAYLSGLKKMQDQRFDTRKSIFPFPSDKDLDLYPEEIYGFKYTEGFQTIVSSTNVGDFCLANSKSISVFSSDNNKECQMFTAVLKQSNSEVSYLHIPGDGDWGNVKQTEVALLPSDILREISLLLQEYDS